jgi:hypothetical protein
MPMLAVFDIPDPDASCPVRFTTTQPSQALAMVNSSFMNDQAQVFADSLVAQAGTQRVDQVRLGLTCVLQRTPTPKEVDRGLAFLNELKESENLSEQESLRQFCLLMLNMNEFLYID